MKKLYYLLAVALLAVSCTQQKKEETTAPLAPNTIQLNDAKTTVTWIKDNQGDKLMQRDLFPAASDSLIEALNLTEGIPSSISTFLMHSDGDWILFDAGLGADKGGQMLNGLKACGLTPDSIKYIYLTHFHGDHIGGLLQDGKPVFPNAQVYASSQEYMAWMMEMPSEQTEWQRNVMDAYKDQTHLFSWGDTLTNGIVAIGAPGHTPGHTVFLKENLLIVGDLMHGAALQLEHPEISGNYDMDKEMAAQSRTEILELVSQNGYTMVGMHLPENAFVHLAE